MRVNVWLVFAGLSVMQPLLSICPCTASEILDHFGTCDASAGAAVGTSRVVVASDEDNILRVYRTDVSGTPVHALDLTSFLGVIGKHPEADIEGAATVGNRVYWITSHGTNTSIRSAFANRDMTGANPSTKKASSEVPTATTRGCVIARRSFL